MNLFALILLPLLNTQLPEDYFYCGIYFDG